VKENALATVLEVQDAELTARAWTIKTRRLALEHMPPDLADAQVNAWMTAVALVQRPDETAPDAAQRLALYLSLHAERYGRAPDPMTAAHHFHDHNQSPEQD
jgi:hypothetical protein